MSEKKIIYCRMVQVFLKSYAFVSMLLGYFFLFLLCLLWAPIASILYRYDAGPRMHNLGRKVISWGLRFYSWLLTSFCGLRLDISSLDMLRESEPLVLAANHPSLLDAIFIVSRVPNVVCIVKSELLKNPLVGPAARLAGYISNDNPLGMILQAEKALQSGAHVLIFPEGGRTRVFPLDQLKRTAAMIAMRSHCPIQLVLMNITSNYLGKHWKWWKPPRLPLFGYAELGERFETVDDPSKITAKMEKFLIKHSRLQQWKSLLHTWC